MTNQTTAMDTLYNSTAVTLINHTINQTTEDGNQTADATHAPRNALAYVHFVIGTYILIANSMVIIAVAKYDYLRTRANMYIVSLAATDLCVGAMEWAVGLHNHAILINWFDRTGPACVGMYSFAFFSVACSMFNMVLIALDRLVYIMKPFLYSRVVTSKRVKITILVLWIVAFAWGSVPLYINTYSEEEAYCNIHLAIPAIYRSYMNVIMLFIGAISTGVFYIVIAVKAFEHKKAIYKSIPGYGKGGEMGDDAKSAISTLRSNMKTLKLFIVVFGLLVICWFPYYIFEFGSNFMAIPESVYRASTALGFLNSGLNFFIYPAFNKKFRRALKHMVCPCWKSIHKRSMTEVSFLPSKEGPMRPAPIPPAPIPAPIPPAPIPAPIPAAPIPAPIPPAPIPVPILPSPIPAPISAPIPPPIPLSPLPPPPTSPSPAVAPTAEPSPSSAVSPRVESSVYAASIHTISTSSSTLLVVQRQPEESSVDLVRRKGPSVIMGNTAPLAGIVFSPDVRKGKGPSQSTGSSFSSGSSSSS